MLVHKVISLMKLSRHPITYGIFHDNLVLKIPKQWEYTYNDSCIQSYYVCVQRILDCNVQKTIIYTDREFGDVVHRLLCCCHQAKFQ